MKVSDTIGDKVQSAIPMDLQIRGAHLYDRTRRWVTRTNGKKLFVEKPIPPSRTSNSPTSTSVIPFSIGKDAGSPTMSACETRLRSTFSPTVRSGRSGQ